MFALLDGILPESAKLNGTKPGGDIVTMLLKKRLSVQPVRVREDPEQLPVIESGPRAV